MNIYPASAGFFYAIHWAVQMNLVINKLITELKKVIDGDPWYGSSLKSIFKGVDSFRAVKRISANSHSIAEIALHMLAWNEEVASRLVGSKPQAPQRGDWQIIEKLDKDEWNNIVQKIFKEHARIEKLVASLSIEKLEEQVGKDRNPALGTGINYREMLVGLMEHNVYHGGQIALLKKLI